MKPLTIDELKSLEIGDWVWIVEYNGAFCYYAKIENTNGSCFSLDNTDLYYSNYGTKWVAYKNKEQVECKGEIVELPCLRDKPSLHIAGNEWIKRKELNYMTKDKTICSIVYWENEFDEAERRFAELKGEE